MIFPLLEGNGIRIRAFQTTHLTERYISWLNDPEVVRYSEQRHCKHTLLTCTHYFEAMQKTNHHFLAIEVDNQDLGHIGNIGVSVDPFNLTADMSIIIGEKRVWGIGFASIAWNTVLKELFENHGIRKITAGTMATNEPMLRMMKRSGMHIESIRQAHFIWQGELVDLVQSAIFSSIAPNRQCLSDNMDLI